jgi:hypothetical protein
VAALFASDTPDADEHSDKDSKQPAKRTRTAAKRALVLMADEPRAKDSSTTSDDDSAFSLQDDTSSSDDDTSDDDNSDDSDATSASSSVEDEHTKRKWALKDLEDICVSSDEEPPDAFVPEAPALPLPSASKPQAKRRNPPPPAVSASSHVSHARTPTDWVRDMRAMASRARASMQPELDRAVHLAVMFNVAVRRASLAQLAKPVRGEDAPFLELSFDMRLLAHVTATLGAMGMYDNMLLKLSALQLNEEDATRNTEIQIAHIHLCDKQFDRQLGFSLLDSSLCIELSSHGLTWVDLMLALFGLAIMSDDSSQIDIKRKQRLRQSLASDAHGPGALLRELVEKWSQAPCSKNKAARPRP